MPKKTTKAIIGTGNHYVLGVKKNQRKLYNQIALLTDGQYIIKSQFTELEKNRGRLERREVMVIDQLESIDKGWVGLKQVIKIRRWVKTKKKTSEEEAFFITSLDVSAQVICKGIRDHWAIENGLHWVKDVTFREDASKIRTSNAPQNISVLRNIAINLFRMNEYDNMAQAQRLVANHIPKLSMLIK